MFNDDEALRFDGYVNKPKNKPAESPPPAGMAGPVQFSPEVLREIERQSNARALQGIQQVLATAKPRETKPMSETKDPPPLELTKDMLVQPPATNTPNTREKSQPDRDREVRELREAVERAMAEQAATQTSTSKPRANNEVPITGGAVSLPLPVFPTQESLAKSMIPNRSAKEIKAELRDQGWIVGGQTELGSGQQRLLLLHKEGIYVVRESAEDDDKLFAEAARQAATDLAEYRRVKHEASRTPELDGRLQNLHTRLQQMSQTLLGAMHEEKMLPSNA